MPWKLRWKAATLSRKQLAEAELAKCGLTSINPFKMRQNVPLLIPQIRDGFSVRPRRGAVTACVRRDNILRSAVVHFELKRRRLWRPHHVWSNERPHTRTRWRLAFFMLSPLPLHFLPFRHEWHSDWLDFFIPELSVLDGHIKPRTTAVQGKRLRASLWVRPRFSFSSRFRWWLVSWHTAGRTQANKKWQQVGPAFFLSRRLMKKFKT